MQKINIHWTTLTLSLCFITIFAIISSHFLLKYISHDPDLDPIQVKSSNTMMRMYLTGPTSVENSLLILFTTLSDSPDMADLHFVTLNNWANLVPFGVRPVLFTTFTNATFLDKAVGLGWDILPLNRTNRYGVPYIKDVFQAAYNCYKSQFYMFASGDTLFDETLVRTLKTLQGLKKHVVGDSRKLFAVGLRSNIPVDGLNPPPFFEFKFIKMLVDKEQPSGSYLLDYFITGPFELPWKQVPELVVGRPGLGSYLLRMALDQGLATIDVTKTLRSVHLKAEFPADRSFRTRAIKDNLYNQLILGQWATDTSVNNTKYTTKIHDANIVIQERTHHDGVSKK